MSPTMPRFALAARVIHWIMAAMILTQLFLGIGMVSTVGELYSRLIAIHRPLGIAILAFAILRLVVRFTNKPPPLPADLPMIQKLAAHGSHLALYALMIAMPLLGWGMLSAANYPIVLFGTVRLPMILPQSDSLHTELWSAHYYLAFLFFAIVLLHLAAALFHALVRHDGVFEAMAPVPRRDS